MRKLFKFNTLLNIFCGWSLVLFSFVGFLIVSKMFGYEFECVKPITNYMLYLLGGTGAVAVVFLFLGIEHLPGVSHKNDLS